MVNLSNEITINIINEIVKVVTYLEVDIKKQIELRNKIEEQLNNYEITSKCTELCTCDILEKAFIFLSCKKLEGMAEGTRNNYVFMFKKLDVYFKKPLTSINTIDLRMFIANTYGDNKQSSQNTIISKLKAFFGWLQDEGYLIQNQSKNLREIKVPYRSRGHIESIDLEKMREACKTKRDKSLIEVLLSTACRVSEISNIKIDDINWTDNSIKVIGKGNKERKVFFSSRAKLFMMDYIKSKENNDIFRDYLFTTSKIPYDKLGSRSIERDVKRIAADAKIIYNVFPHLYRRTLSTISVEQGVNVTSLKEILGHSSISTTQRYYDINSRNVQHDYKKIAL